MGGKRGEPNKKRKESLRKNEGKTTEEKKYVPSHDWKIGLCVGAVLALVSNGILAASGSIKNAGTANIMPEVNTQQPGRMTFQPDPSGKPVFATRSCGHYDVEASLCSPPPKCGRYIREKFISEEEVKQLRQLAESAMWHGGGSGPPTVFDVPSGALSHGNNFINLWAMLQEQADKGQPHPNRIDPDLMFTYLNVTSRVQNLVAKRFGIKSNQFGLTRPSFFSRMRGYVKPKTKHDEYWHEHIDTEQYGTFTLTVLIYLNQHGSDFQGGQFVFGRKPYVSTEKGETKGDKQDWQVNPKPGTLLAFSSGPENAHWVERVTSGERFALTIAFSCTTENHVTEHLTNLANTMREQEKQYEQEKQAGDGAAAPATSTA